MVFAAHVLTPANQAQLDHLEKAEREYAQAAVALGRELQGDQPDSVRTGRALLALAKAQQKLGQHEVAHASLVEAERPLAHTVDDTQLSLIEARALLHASAPG
jgi:hypothetical protein